MGTGSAIPAAPRPAGDVSASVSEEDARSAEEMANSMLRDSPLKGPCLVLVIE